MPAAAAERGESVPWSASGSLLYTLNVEGDTTTEITLTLDGCDSGRSNLQCDEVWEITDKNITWAMVYDLESNETNCEEAYTLMISCTPLGAPQLDTNFQLQVFIYDVNDNDPRFVDTPYSTDVSELAAIGHTVYVVSSEDKDCGARQLLYSVIDGSGADYFDFESANTPYIIITDSLDFELCSEYKLTLMVDVNHDGTC
ncbi:protocadherin gamma-B4-like [Ptychodera flava]|uniref:protocadherin gamma-B4-like n=1 Tax=Ptychodera flava TaxID=63121 RepID=UPI003969D832